MIGITSSLGATFASDLGADAPGKTLLISGPFSSNRGRRYQPNAIAAMHQMLNTRFNCLAIWNGYPALVSGTATGFTQRRVLLHKSFASGQSITIGEVNAVGATGGSLEAMAVYGSDLVIAGTHFTAVTGGPGITGASATRIARCDGTSWHALGAGLSGQVWSLHVSGSHLYAGGVNFVQRWNGSSWTSLGNPSGTVLAVCVHGGSVYCGGAFGIRRLVGSDWEDVASGINGTVWQLASYGGSLIAGGRFDEAGSGPTTVHNLARLSGSSWVTMDGGLPPLGGLSPTVRCMTPFNNWLAIGVTVPTFGTYTGRRITAWDGANLLDLGSDVDADVRAMAGYDLAERTVVG